MYQSFTLSRYMGDDTDHGTTFTVADDDAVNVAHMLAAGFNTMSRNFLNGAALAVVYSDGRVQYDGKSEQVERPDPRSVSQTFNFEASPGGDHMVTLFDNEHGRLIFPGKLKFTENTKAAADLAKSAAGHIARSVLEEAYEELQAVKEVLFNAGAETITADVGVRDLVEMNATQSAAIEQQNEAARAEMVSFVKRSYAKKLRIQAAGESRPELDDRWRGMLDVLAKFLVITGEAEQDESHAVARRLCGIED